MQSLLDKAKNDGVTHGWVKNTENKSTLV